MINDRVKPDLELTFLTSIPVAGLGAIIAALLDRPGTPPGDRKAAKIGLTFQIMYVVLAMFL